MGAVRERQTIIWLAVVDAVLVVVLVLLAMRSVLGTGAGSVAPTSAGASASTKPSVAVSGREVDFVMPSGNVACRMSEERVTCVIDRITYTSAPGGCTAASAGHVVVLDPSGVSTPCTPTETPRTDGAQELAYGTVARAGDYVCVSAESGVTCTDADGTGFRLARSALTVLP